MKLKKWRVDQGLTQTELADLLETTQNNISRYELGLRQPHAAILKRIFAATGGLVTANDFYDLPDTATPVANHVAAVG